LGEDPDVIVLQEVYDTALIEAFIEKLEDRYAHFYTHLGPNTFGSESGCMVITKCPVHKFTYSEFNNNNASVNRGFATLEIKASPEDKQPCARIIGTQLTPDKGQTQKRAEQMAQIVNSLAQSKPPLPTLFVGGLPDPDDELLSKYLSHSYRGKGPTHTDELISQWSPVFDGQEEPSDDFISLFKRNLPDGRTLPVIEKNISLVDSHLGLGFDENCDTKTAVSDHHPMLATLGGLKECQIGA
jgi:hypothetical protein